MRIAILSEATASARHERLLKAAEVRGHTVQPLRLSYCYMNISAVTPKVFYRDGVVKDVDAIIPLIESAQTLYGASVLRQFEMMGTLLLNSPLAITWSRDKLRVLQWLTRKKIHMPITGFADSPQETERLVSLVGGAPLIVKLLEGTEGRGTIFAETRHAAVSVINAFKQLKVNILVQEFIRSDKGGDIRCLVLDGKVVAAIHRSANKRECTAIKITAEERKMAIHATGSMKLNLAAVDLIRSERGPLFLDINANPNWVPIEQATGKDVAGLIVDFLAEHLAQGR